MPPVMQDIAQELAFALTSAPKKLPAPYATPASTKWVNAIKGTRSFSRQYILVNVAVIWVDPSEAATTRPEYESSNTMKAILINPALLVSAHTAELTAVLTLVMKEIRSQSL